METSHHIDVVGAEGAALADAAAAAGLSAPVPPCPGWDVAALLRHVGGVHRFWIRMLTERVTERPTFRSDGVDVADAAVEGWYREGLDELVGALRAADPAMPLWNWTGLGGGDVAWAARRMAQETAVHRWDADAAAGRASAIDAELASDGIDEFLTQFLSRPHRDSAPIAGSAHVHCTDVPGEWLVVEDEGQGIVVTREHAKGSCALRGPASDLLLVVWGRAPLSSIEVIGDADVAARFVARARR